MSEKDLSKALRNIIEKELKGLSKILPKDVISNIEKKSETKLEAKPYTHGDTPEGSPKRILQGNPEQNPGRTRVAKRAAATASRPSWQPSPPCAMRVCPPWIRGAPLYSAPPRATS